ncbi:LLM class flavin-dependent oxidoreductase [Flexivirga oryzae]|uniref:Alkanesulfonate monooxygenase SsuD/methylene tetrahydromethanopterin reductase-like flavin-dependent oxidoreductase (Luciferase family) n=1 Tax=Flexivirga oryzae TaxID=1794944 RepID=A0A839NAV1_9MICO|nr:LLM class flavin-dependent oxidoreductase [Flexivirga oryzae]MBB2894347.1 alkanesulfonate monooxygenase SsuD/methylene tetrahydromethanopterin reductase-like flavin-dependent oxidoreductase (luciferase family) [Flexivirga oryzae]
MKVIAISLIVHAPDPVTGEQVSTHQRFAQVVRAAEFSELIGLDGFGVGERHERPFISSAPTVVLSHLAARTKRLRLFTAVTTLSLLDPVRAYEDYATLDHLSEGRLELIIGKGNGSAQRDLFAVTEDDQWDRNAESYEVFRSLWRQDKVTADTRFRPALRDAEVWPRPFQQPVRVWHGSATSRASVDLAARYGEPLFSANVTNPIEPYAELIDHYRERWAHYGHDPAALTVVAGSAGLSVSSTSQRARSRFAPAFAGYLAAQRRLGVEPVFATIDDYIERSSALIGSPAQVLDKIQRYHERFGHTVLHVGADAQGISEAAHRESLELFAEAVLPALRTDIPDPPVWGPGELVDDGIRGGAPAGETFLATG